MIWKTVGFECFSKGTFLWYAALLDVQTHVPGDFVKDSNERFEAVDIQADPR